MFSKQRFNPPVFDDVKKVKLQFGEIGLLKQLKVCVSNMCRFMVNLSPCNIDIHFISIYFKRGYVDRFSIRIGCSSSYFHGDVVLLSQNTGQQRQTGHDVFGPEHGSPQSDVGDICRMVLRDGHKGDFFRDSGLLAYGEHVIGEKRVHDVLRGMPFDEPLAVLQH